MKGASSSPESRPAGRIVSKTQIARNISWNWAGTAAQVVAAFIVAPFLIRELGDATYGLWILLISVIDFLGLFDLGVRTSVSRQLTYSRSLGDQDGVNAVLNSALGIASCVGLLVCAATVAIASLPPDTHYILEQISRTRRAMLLLGMGFAFYSISQVFDGTLRAFQRFDTLNIIDISINVLRAGLMYVFVFQGYGLNALATITVMTNAAAALAKGAFCFRFDPNLEIRPRRASWSTARGLYSYGAWNFVTMVGSKIRLASAPVLISASLGVALVTPFSIAMRVVSYATLVLQGMSAVITPVATALDARQMGSRLQRLILDGGKFCAVLSLFFATWLIVLSKYFIALWIGPRLSDSAALVTILASGEIVPMSQLVSQSVLLGMARHHVLSYWSLGEAVAGTLLGAILMKFYGLTGLCIGLAIAAAVCRGLAILIYTCRVTQTGLQEYLGRAIVPALAAAVPPAVGLWLVVVASPPDTWIRLCLYSGLLAAGFGLSSIPLLGYANILEGRRRLLEKVRGAS